VVGIRSRRGLANAPIGRAREDSMGGGGREGSRIVTYEMGRRRRRRSLHEFICREINPRLEAGWAVSDVRIKCPEPGTSQSCRLDVVLVRSEAEAQTATP
jgi:hypothetical protein